jgi:acetylglutamate kinase
MQGLWNSTIGVRVDEESLACEGATVARDLAFLVERGVRPIVVAPSPAVAKSYVRTMNRTANAAVGLSGCDGALLPAASADGKIAAVQVGILRTLTAAGYVPVIEPTALGIGGDDVDAEPDDIAAAIAAATEASRAIFFHAAGGVVDPESASLVEELTAAEAFALADRPDLDAGLCTAIRAAARGVRAGVGAAQIVDGRVAHAAVVEFLTSRHIGTQVTGGVFLG